MVPGGTGNWERADALLGSSCGSARNVARNVAIVCLPWGRTCFLLSCELLASVAVMSPMNVTVLPALFNYVPREDWVSDYDRQPSAVILAFALLLCTMSGSFLLFWATDILLFLPSLSLSSVDHLSTLLLLFPTPTEMGREHATSPARKSILQRAYLSLSLATKMS